MQELGRERLRARCGRLGLCRHALARDPNRSTNPRRGLVYQISAGDSIQLGGNLHKVWGTWLKGSDPLQARLPDGTTYRLTAPLTNKGGLQPTGNWRQETQD